MGFYSSVHKESRIARVVAMGNTFRLPGLQRYLQQNLTLDVEKFGSLGSQPIEDPKAAALFSENVLSAAGAYGLALQVMGQGKIASNLLPERIRQEKVWREKTKWFAAAAAVFVAGAGVAYGAHYLNEAQFHSADSDALAGNIDRVETTASGLSSKYETKVEQAGAADRQRLVNVMSLANGRQVWPEINDLLYSNLPQNDPNDKTLATANPDEIKKVPRGERKQILVTGLLSKYYPDLNPIVTTNSQSADLAINTPVLPTQIGAIQLQTPAAGSNGPAAGAATAPPQRGYVITLQCTSPNANGAQLIDAYRKQLIAATQAGNIRVLDAKIVSSSKVKDDQQAVAKLVAEYTARKQRELQASDPAGGRVGGGASPGMPSMGGGGPSLLGRGGAPAASAVPDEAYEARR